MLSRVADSLYWMSRYVERAENIARMVDVNLHTILDFKDLDEDKLKEHWHPLILTSGDEERFEKDYGEANSETCTEFLTFDRGNPNSVINCVIAARENARSVRDQITGEMWESLNDLYFFVKSQNAKRVWQTGASHFYDKIKDYSQMFQGLVSATIPRDEGYDFIEFGKYLERADKTTRMLDIKYHILLPSMADVGGAVDTAQWVALLRSASALEAYHQVYVSNIEPAKVSEFLIFAPNFPRSIRFCVSAMNDRLHRISGSPVGTFVNEAEKQTGRLLSDLTFGSVDDVVQKGMHEWLDECQERLNVIGKETYETYMFLRPLDVAMEIRQQQQQQQQQE